MDAQCQVNAVASEFMTPDDKTALLNMYQKVFSELKIQIVSDHGSEALPLLYFVCTGGTEQSILSIQKDRATDEDIILIAHATNNSLPAALEVMARLQQLGRTGRIIYFRSPDDFAAVNQLREYLHFVQVDHRLKTRRIGRIGESSEWLVASNRSDEMIRSVWGPETVEIELGSLIDSVKKLRSEHSSHGDHETDRESSDIFSTSELLSITDLTIEPEIEETEAAIEILSYIQTLVKTHSLNAVTLQCFSIIKSLKTTGCYALAMLNDEGVVAGCEGDMVSTLTMLMIRELTGETSWMANPAQIDTATNSVWLAHCTVPCSMIGDYRIRSHFESGLGVAIQGQMRMQPVTLLRVGGIELDRYWLAEGEIIQTGTADDLCRTQARIELIRGNVDDLLSQPLGNHLILVYGQRMDMIQRYMTHRKLTAVR